MDRDPHRPSGGENFKVTNLVRRKYRPLARRQPQLGRRSTKRSSRSAPAGEVTIVQTTFVEQTAILLAPNGPRIAELGGTRLGDLPSTPAKEEVVDADNALALQRRPDYSPTAEDDYDGAALPPTIARRSTPSTPVGERRPYQQHRAKASVHTYSPDGQKIAYSSYDEAAEIYTIDVGGGGEGVPVTKQHHGRSIVLADGRGWPTRAGTASPPTLTSRYTITPAGVAVACPPIA